MNNLYKHAFELINLCICPYMWQLNIEITDYSGMVKKILPYYCKAFECVPSFEAKRPSFVKLQSFKRLWAA